MHRFWLNSQNIKDSQISGKEGFPGEFLKPVSHNILLSSEMLNLMVEYYNATYESFGFRRPLVEGSKLTNSEGVGLVQKSLDRHYR
ncbi:hypothetical protein RirG_132980 [Rhizophagus irregularis DAOM 197198w]|uniref:Uncharacterized protein n=1 Tax=Rhizophagus irregularis (strain DAOM 197198w) TaxID=1432141 RepID=A0A015MF77_RHIIW|nr:hypothetical protein RirG_132980 [Rhizophagus irregularis DAOM 197198w]